MIINDIVNRRSALCGCADLVRRPIRLAEIPLYMKNVLPTSLE